MGSYADQFGGNRNEIYTLFIQGQGEVSWYSFSELTLIESNRLDLLVTWEKEIQDERSTKGNIDWIFRHGPEVLIVAYGASIETLARGVGIDNLWGDHGEGISYYTNAMRVLVMAQPFLATNDKDGWLAFCAQHPRISAVDYVIE